MAGLLDSLIGAITPKLAPELGQQLGESPEAVKKGLETGSAAILGGIASKAGDSGIMSKIFGLATSLGGTGAPAAEGPAAAPSGGVGSSFLSTIFGAQSSSIMDTIGKVSGLKSGSITGIMTALVPAVLGFLGNSIKSKGLNPSGFADMLKAEAPSIANALPAGLGKFMPVGVAAPVAAMAGHAHRNWLWLLLIGAALIGAIWWWQSRPKEVTGPAGGVGEPGVTAPAAGDFIKRKLPNGVEISIPRSGVEARLLDAAESGKIDNTKWFVLDGLQFNADSTALQPASHEKLASIADILKAYPKINVKLGGFADSAGDAATNLKLSQTCADTVKAELVSLGVAGDRLQAKGYGQENVAGTTTEAGRRVAMQLTTE